MVKSNFVDLFRNIWLCHMFSVIPMQTNKRKKEYLRKADKTPSKKKLTFDKKIKISDICYILNVQWLTNFANVDICDVTVWNQHSNHGKTTSQWTKEVVILVSETLNWDPCPAFLGIFTLPKNVPWICQAYTFIYIIKIFWLIHILAKKANAIYFHIFYSANY